MIMQYQILREPQVSVLTGLSRSTRWRLEREGKFPQKRQLSAKSVGWLASEVEEWVRTRNIIKTGSINEQVS